MQDELLIVRYLSGEASPEEAIQLESWMAASSRNRKVFNELWNSWQYTANEPYVTPVAANDWQQLMQHWQKAGLPVTATTSLSFILKALVITLSSLAAAAGIWWWLRHNSASPAAPLVTAATSTVVKDTLADNSTYTLDVNSRIAWNAAQKQLALQGGMMLKNTAPVQLTTGKILLNATPGYYYVHYDSMQQQTTVYVAEGALTIHTFNGDTTITKEASVQVDEKRGQWLRDYRVNKNRFSFATRHFYFENTPLPEVAAYLEKAYGITITIAGAAINNCSLTGQFNYVPVSQILDMLALTVPITYVYKESEKTVYISGKGCE